MVNRPPRLLAEAGIGCLHKCDEKKVLEKYRGNYPE
jgi:hypothetical protein